MNETKLLRFSDYYTISHQRRVKNITYPDGKSAIINDYPDLQAELDQYLARGWQLVNMSVDSKDGDLLFLLVR